MYSDPLAYFISFRAYGTWLHGDDRGSVDRVHNVFGEPTLPPSERRVAWEQSEAVGPPMAFDDARRACIDHTIREVCEHKRWALLALNVRTNHVHVVVSARPSPEVVMSTFKVWATRRMTEAGLIERGTRVWSRHGSTIYLFKPEKVEEKRLYVEKGP